MEIILVELCYRLTWYQAYYQLDLYTRVDPYYIVYNYRLLDKYTVECGACCIVR